MALQSFTVSIGALRDVNNNDKNYVSGEAIYVKTIGGSFATIFRDLAGTSEISQDGLANQTNEKGQLTFFVEAGDYVLEYQNQSTPVTIVGADYFNSRIEETVNQIIIDTSKSRGFRVVGDFASGFTYELPNDVAIDGDGNYWAYADINALPVTVTAGTTPTEGEYSQRTWNSASAVITNGGGTVQSFVDSFSLKIFQSPTDGGLTEIQTRTVDANEVYEVRKTSDDSLATIYSDATGTTEIVQNGTANKSGSDGAVRFYVEDTFDELKIEIESGVSNFKNNVFIQQSTIENGIGAWDTGTVYALGGIAKGSDNAIYQALTEQSGNDPVSDGGVNWIKLSINSIEGISDYVFSSESEMVSNPNNIDYKVGLALKVQSVNGAFSNYSIVDYTSDVGLGSGLWAKKLLDSDNIELGFKKSEFKPSYPSGQIANEAEVVMAYKGAIYLLFKGSYSGNDNSYISVIRPNGNELKESIRIDLGIGADARGMTIYDDSLIVFTNGKIEVFRLIDMALQKKYEITRSGGFVQSCRVINGYLYACNWGDGTVEVYDLIEGIPSNKRSYSVGATGNATIASWGNIHYLLTWTDTNNLTRLDLNRDGSINSRGTFTVPGVWRPRYATIENGIMYVGGFSTLNAKTVILDISGNSPVKLDEVMNMFTSVKVGDYLLGTGTDQTVGFEDFYQKFCRVNINTGEVEEIDSRPFLYPTKYEDTFFAFIYGDEGLQPGSGPADSPLGQGISVWTNSNIEEAFFQEGSDEGNVNLLPATTTIINNFSPGDVIGKVLKLSPSALGFFRCRVWYQITNNQNLPGSWDSTTADIAFSFYRDSGNNWIEVEPPVIFNRLGSLTTDIELAIVGGELVLQVVGSALTNALINITLQYERTNVESSSFIYSGELSL